MAGVSTRKRALVNYHVRDDAPQAFHFELDGIFGNISSPELVSREVFVRDVRGHEETLGIKANGVLFSRHETRAAGTLGSARWRAEYNVELQVLLTQKLDAKEVIVFDHTVRLDQEESGRKPARNVHNDYSPAGAQQRLVDLLGKERAEKFRNGHYAFVNVWRPLENVQTSPLGFVHPRSIEEQDWVTIDLVYPDRRGEILRLVENRVHDWFYLSDMRPDEMVIFNVYDSAGLPVLAHSALDPLDGAAPKGARKSVESRTLVRYR